MALTEQVVLDIASAQRQIDTLEGQLSQLSQPINVPVNVGSTNDLNQVRQTLGQADDAVENLNRELGQTDDQLRTVGREADDATDAILRVGTRGTSAFTSLRGSLLGVAAGFGAIAAGRAFLDFASQSITAASDLEQSVGALDAVFGEMSEELQNFGTTADQSVGLAASQFNQLASLLGSQLQTFGFNVSDASAKTQELITLSADLAATFGGPVSQAVEAISSLLRGEVNPIERYGVAMNETLVAAKALELGLAGTTAELTLQDKTLARLAILTEQTANAQGQFARESETTAGRLERVRAEFENTRAEVGDALIPAFETLLGLAPALSSVITDGLVPALQSLGDTLAGIDTEGFTRTLAGLPSAVTTTFGQIGDGVAFLTNTFQGLGDLLRGELTTAFDNFATAGARFDNIGTRGTFNRAVQDLLTTIQSGRPALASFGDVLANVASTTELDTDDLKELALTLADIAGVTEDAGGLRDLRDSIIELGAQAGFSEPELRALIQVLDQLVLSAQAGGGEARDFPLFEVLGRAGEEAELAAAGFGVSIAQIEASLTGLRSSTADFDFSELETAFREELPNALDAAGEALRDEEGEIVSDFGTFLAQLQEELAAATEFQTNLDLLRSLGFDDLATVFEQAGIESAGALADGLANPAELAAAERALEDAAREMARAEAEAFGRDVRAFIEQFDPIEMPIVLVPDFSRITGASLPLLPGDRAGVSDTSPVSTGGGGGTTVNFFTEPRPTTQTSRAIQSIATLN